MLKKFGFAVVALVAATAVADDEFAGTSTKDVAPAAPAKKAEAKKVEKKGAEMPTFCQGRDRLFYVIKGEEVFFYETKTSNERIADAAEKSSKMANSDDRKRFALDVQSEEGVAGRKEVGKMKKADFDKLQAALKGNSPVAAATDPEFGGTDAKSKTATCFWGRGWGWGGCGWGGWGWGGVVWTVPVWGWGWGGCGWWVW